MVGDKTWLDVGFVLCMDNWHCMMNLFCWEEMTDLLHVVCFYLLRSNSGHWSTPTDVQCPCLLICVRMQWERQKFVIMLPCVKIWVNVHNSSTRTYYDTSISVYRHLCNHTSAHLFLFDILMCDCWFYYATIRCRLIP